MKLLKALRRFLASVPARASGTHLPVSCDNVVRLHSSAPTGSSNVIPYIAPVQTCSKPMKITRLAGSTDTHSQFYYEIEDQEDTFQPLPDVPESDYPIG